MYVAHSIDKVEIEDISCDVLNMEFFDRLWVRGVVRDGEMVQSKADSWGDIPCPDDVRKVSIIEFCTILHTYSRA